MIRSIERKESNPSNKCALRVLRFMLWTASASSILLSPFLLNAVFAKGYVATFAPDGTLLSWFDAQMIGNQLISSVDVDPAGNIWVGRQDTGHALSPNPNDKVVKYSPVGTPLLTIKGPMRAPNGVAFDSAGNVFVTGEVDSTFTPAIFKYDASGAFIKSFGTPALSHPDDWRDINITSTDRLFACGTLEGTIAEFTTAGTAVRTLGLGSSREPLGFAFGNDGNSLFTLDLANGPGTDHINHYNLNLQFISGFNTNVVRTPWDNVQNGSIEVLPNGNLVVGASTKENSAVPVVQELSPDGTILQTLQFPSINMIAPDARRAVLAFDMTPQGNYIFGVNTLSDGDVPEPSTVLLACGPIVMWFVNVRHGRRASPCAT